MSIDVTVRVRNSSGSHTLAGVLVEGGEEAQASFGAALRGPGSQLLMVGDRSYHVSLKEAPNPEAAAVLRDRVGKRAWIRFIGRRGTYRQRLAAIGGADLLGSTAAPDSTTREDPTASQEAAKSAGSLDLASTIYGAKPLYLLADGMLSADPAGPAPLAMDALAVMVTAARWVSS
ncbi:MAG TPA: hypothetical protein ENJ18_05285, partial [Nannocystis exedens]|nr:hypothetical protein [Nannocystis exedens]